MGQPLHRVQVHRLARYPFCAGRARLVGHFAPLHAGLLLDVQAGAARGLGSRPAGRRRGLASLVGARRARRESGFRSRRRAGLRLLLARVQRAAALHPEYREVHPVGGPGLPGTTRPDQLALATRRLGGHHIHDAPQTRLV